MVNSMYPEVATAIVTSLGIVVFVNVPNSRIVIIDKFRLCHKLFPFVRTFYTGYTMHVRRAHIR